MAGRKRSNCFFVTINNVSWSKKTVGEWLLIDNLVTELAVGEESYSPPLDPDTEELTVAEPGRHHHIFVRFTEALFLNDVRDIINVFLCDEVHSMDIQVCLPILPKNLEEGSLGRTRRLL
jgi:hypothetical protein